MEKKNMHKENRIYHVKTILYLECLILTCFDPWNTHILPEKPPEMVASTPLCQTACLRSQLLHSLQVGTGLPSGINLHGLAGYNRDRLEP